MLGEGLRMADRREHVRFENAHGERLMGVFHYPAEKTDRCLIVCHGFASSKDLALLWHLCDEAQKVGIAGFRFDFAGLGDSQGEFQDSTYSKQMSDLCKAIDLCVERGYTRIALCGHSMGGAVSLLVAAQDQRVRAVVDIAAPSHPETMAERFLVEKNGDRIDLTMGNRTYTLTQRFIDDLSLVDVDAAVRRISAPILFVHGDADRIVPIKNSEHLYEIATSTDKDLQAIAGGNHLLSRHHQEVAKLVANWLNKRL